MSKKAIKPLIVLGSMAVGALIYESCSKGKKKKNGKKIKKRISREIEFNKNASHLEKSKIINETERQILESLYKQEWRGLIIQSIRFYVNPGIEDRHVIICAKVCLILLKEGSKPPDKGNDQPVS